MRDTDGDRRIELDVATEVDGITDRRVEQDDLGAKMMLTNQGHVLWEKWWASKIGSTQIGTCKKFSKSPNNW